MGYENGKIYKITGSGLTYYGSTILTLNQRKTIHKQTINKKLSCMSREIINKGDWEMILVEDFKCENKEELLWRERWWIENNECINKSIPIVNDEEKIINKIKSDKKYKEANKDIIYKKQNDKRLENIKEKRIIDKIYREANKDKINERRKELRRINKLKQQNE